MQLNKMSFEQEMTFIGKSLDTIKDNSKVAYCSFQVAVSDECLYTLSFRFEGEGVRQDIDFLSYEEVCEYLFDILDILYHGETICQGIIIEKDKLKHLSNKVKQKEELCDRWKQ